MTETDRQIHFSASDVEKMVVEIDKLFDATGAIFNQNQWIRDPESIAAKESEELKSPEQSETIYSIATISMEAAADHLAAFSELLKEPVKTLAPFTCVRSLMEMSALCCWLLDPSIDAKARLGRTFAHRFAEFQEQRKVFGTTKDKNQLDKILKRIDKVESDAVAFGFARLRDKKGQIYGIAQPYPTIIELMRLVFGKEFDYRVLSGVAHGQMWALQQAGFKLVEIEAGDGNRFKALTKDVLPNITIYFGMVAVVCFSKVLFSLWEFFGWNKKELVRLLETTFENLGYKESVRFWRT